MTIGKGGAGGFGGFRHGTTTTGTPPAGTGGGAPPTGAGGGGGGFPGGAGGFAGGNSKFAKAFTACRKKLGIKGFSGGFGGAGRFHGGGAGGSGFTPRISTATLKSYVACIRKNGYAAMPEPKALGKGQFFPKNVETNAKFKAANKKCESVLLKAFRSVRPGAGGTGGGTSTISGTSTASST